MPIKLQNSVFVHIPKTGGRWVGKQLMDNVQGSSYIGDPIYDAHTSPDTELPVFAFVRHPITMLNSLWKHRARKHSNTRHKPWNWQENIKLERECGCPDYEKFFENVAARPGIVFDYYMHFVGKYPSRSFGRMEYLAADLIFILGKYNESAKVNNILKAQDSKIGHANNDLPIVQRPDLVQMIIENEKALCSEFQYTAEEILNA